MRTHPHTDYTHFKKGIMSIGRPSDEIKWMRALNYRTIANFSNTEMNIPE